MKADSLIINKPFQPIKVSFIIESQEEYDTILKMANLPAMSIKDSIARQHDKIIHVNVNILHEFLSLLHQRLLTTNK